MSIKDKYRVLPIERSDYKDWVLHKHYAKRMPSVMYAFGLYDNTNVICGIVLYGTPPCQMNNGKASFKTIKINMIELTRLVINDNLEKNLGSYFISQSFKLLPKPTCVVSYADPNNNHHGYVYQSSNWIYTGLSQKGGKDKQWIWNGRQYHAKTITIEKMKSMRMDYDNNLNMTQNWKNNGGQIEENTLRKYRYIYMLCNKKLKKKLLKDMKYEILEYPKGDNKRYDTSYEPDVQPILF